MSRRPPRALLAAAWVTCAAALAGCGSLAPSGEDLPRRDVRLLLDAEPNGVHAGIHLAAARGFDRGEGVTLRIRRPGTRGASELLRRERVDAAILDIHELARARRRSGDLVGVMAVVQRPLDVVLARAPVRTPSALADRRVAIGGTPEDAATVRSMVSADGGDPDSVRLLRTAATAEALRTGRAVAALVPGHLADGGLSSEQPLLREFDPQDYGAPAYPQLVLVVTRYTLEEHPGTVRALIRTLQRGYREAAVDPESAAAAMIANERNLDREALLAQIAGVAPAWTAGAQAYGQLDREALDAWARWAVAFGALRRDPQVERAFATGFVSRPRSS